MHSWVCSTKEKYIGGPANRLYYYIYILQDGTSRNKARSVDPEHEDLLQQ